MIRNFNKDFDITLITDALGQQGFKVQEGAVWRMVGAAFRQRRQSLEDTKLFHTFKASPIQPW